MESYRRFMLVAAVIAISLSTALYGLHFVLFHDVRNSLDSLLGDLAYLPIEVLLVVLILERILNQWEKRNVFLKMSVIMGAFFSKVGNQLLAELTPLFNECRGELNEHLWIKMDWKDSDFRSAIRYIRQAELVPTCSMPDLKKLAGFLDVKRQFLFQLIQNQYVLEHEDFSDVLLSLDHLDDELEARQTYPQLPETDTKHLEGDIGRFYTHLVYQWLV